MAGSKPHNPNSPFKLTNLEMRTMTALCQYPDNTIVEIAEITGTKLTRLKDALKNASKKMKTRGRPASMKKFLKASKEMPKSELKTARELHDLKLETDLLNERQKYAKLKESFDALSKEHAKRGETITDQNKKLRVRQDYILKLETDLRSLNGRHRQLQNHFDELEKENKGFMQSITGLNTDIRKQDEYIRKLTLKHEDDRAYPPTHCTLCKSALDQMETEQ